MPRVWIAVRQPIVRLIPGGSEGAGAILSAGNQPLPPIVEAMKTRKTQQDPLLGLFQAELRKKLGRHLKQLILFGSRARGDNDPDSDYDFLAVLDEATSPAKESIDETVGEFLYDHDAVFAVVPVAESRFKGEPFNPLFRNVAREGVVL
jgi:predicted nucleotidyltransferase